MPEEGSPNTADYQPNCDPLIDTPVILSAHEQAPSASDEKALATAQDNSTKLDDIRKGESWLIFIGIAGVLVNIVIACLYLGQLALMRTATEASTNASKASTKSANLAADSLDTSNSNFDRTMAQTIHQTAAQVQSAQAAQDAVRLAQEQMRLDQRAWIGIEIIPANNPAGMNFGALPTYGTGGAISQEVIIVARNTGKTPAVMLRTICCNYKETEFAEAAPDYDALEDQKRKDLIVDNESRRDSIIHSNPSQTSQITASFNRQRKIDLQDLETSDQREEQGVIPPNGIKALNINVATNKMKFKYAVGKFVYRDVLDRIKDHTTTFCLVKYSQEPLRLCDTGQDMN